MKILYDYRFRDFAQTTTGGVDGRIDSIFLHVNDAWDDQNSLGTKVVFEIVDRIFIDTQATGVEWANASSPYVRQGL